MRTAGWMVCLLAAAFSIGDAQAAAWRSAKPAPRGNQAARRDVDALRRSDRGHAQLYDFHLHNTSGRPLDERDARLSVIDHELATRGKDHRLSRETLAYYTRHQERTLARAEQILARGVNDRRSAIASRTQYEASVKLERARKLP